MIIAKALLEMCVPDEAQLARQRNSLSRWDNWLKSSAGDGAVRLRMLQMIFSFFGYHDTQETRAWMI